MIESLILGAMAGLFLLLILSVVDGRVRTDRTAHGAQIPDPRKGGDT